MLKKFLIALVLVCAGFSAYSTTDIQPNGNLAGGSTAANCTQPVLGTYSGSTNFEAKWRANSVPLRWYNEGSRITNVQDAAKTCTYDGVLNIPSTAPSRTGYTFGGWRVITGLPAGYTELEYISKSGMAYIDSGINQKNTVGVKIDVKFDTYGSSYQYVIGAYTSSDYIGIWKASSSSLSFCYVSKITQKTTSDTTSFHTVSANYMNDRKYTYDGNTVAVIDQTKNATTPTIYIGDTNNSSHFSSSFSFKNVKITDGQSVVFNGIPAKRNSDNAVGLYDTVSGTFLTKTGSGTFTAGPALD